MAQIYYRENGIRGTMIAGPFADIVEAQLAVRAAGLKPRDVGFLRKEGANLVKIIATAEEMPLRQTG